LLIRSFGHVLTAFEPHAENRSRLPASKIGVVGGTPSETRPAAKTAPRARKRHSAP